mgnify:CR=1 FL=1
MEKKQIIPMNDVKEMAQTIAKSGLFPDINTTEKAFALMILCQAEGLHPMEALRRYNIISGRPAMKADAMLAEFNRRGGKVEWLQHTDEVVKAKFTHPNGSSIIIEWTIERAAKIMQKGNSLTKKDNWRNYPRQMLRARTISEGVRAVMPEVCVGIYTPEEVFKALEQCAIRKGYKQIRISGNEPTIGRSHLLKVLELVDRTNLLFILETNGILIGNDKSYARDLAKFKRLHVRVSIKGTSPEEFSKLTGAIPEAFELQLKSLENLLNAGVSCHPAVMLSFSGKEGFKRILERLKEIDPILCEELEEEYVFLYPHVVKRLSASGITPLIAFSPKNIPEDLI